MIVAHVIDSSGLYGAEQVILTLMHAQRQIGIHPILLSIGNKSSSKFIENACLEMGFHFLRLRFSNGLNIFGSLKLVSTAKSLGVTVFHTHGYKPNILLGLLPRANNKIPIVCTLHGWTHTKFFSRIFVYEFLDLLLLRRLDAVVSVTKFPRYYKLLKRLKIQYFHVPNGIIDLNDTYDSISHQKHSIKNHFTKADILNIVIIARLSHEKGFEYLLSALFTLVSNEIPITLTIIGDGQYRSSLEQTVSKYELAERVFFTGYIREAYRLLPAFDLFILASLTEASPITVLEAMRAGIPIVATSVGDIPYMLDHGRCGTLIPKKSSRAIFDAICDIYYNYQNALLKAKNAQMRVVSTFSGKSMASQYNRIYFSVM
jgi:glycosyltransferase involved in cell wall biosynthesis